MFTTAIKTQSGNLKVIVWELSSLGKISRLSDKEFGAVNAISSDSIVAQNRLVLALLDSNHRLRLKLIEIDGEDGKVVEIDTVVGDSVTSADVEVMGRFATVYMDNSAGRLEVARWLVKRASLTKDTGFSYVSGPVTAPRVAKRWGGRDLKSWVGFVDSDNLMKTTTFNRWNSDEVTITRGDSETLDSSSGISVSRHPEHIGYWSAVRDPDSKLRVNFWGHGFPLGSSSKLSALAAKTDSTIRAVSCVAAYQGNYLITASVSGARRIAVAAWRAEGVQVEEPEPVG